jgi:TM2 domain-containing membrane protein YozV/cold shock CspA family protein
MKGKVLDFNIQSGEGIISADNGERYTFVVAEWKTSTIHPTKDVIVDFNINDDKQACEIYAEEQKVASGEGKSKIVAALLEFFLGGLGIHKFYLGCNKAGIIMLIVSILGVFLAAIPTLIIGLIAFIEFIVYLIKSDEEFHRIYVENKKCWF